MEQRAVAARGIKLSDIDKCVCDITDRRVKQQLREENRNKIVHKIVLDRPESRVMLLGESDDFIMCCDCTLGGYFTWYVKQRKQVLSICPNLQTLDRLLATS